jgi:nucleotide-binding universal stress UspA family protein
MDAIVVGTDGSRDAEAAVQKVIEFAPGSGATVHVVCTYPGRTTLERLGLTAREENVSLRGVAADVAARAESRLREAGFEVETHVQEGDPAHAIIEIAEESGAKLIAIGTHGNSGERRFTLGSVAGKLSHHSPTSLLLVRAD